MSHTPHRPARRAARGLAPAAGAALVLALTAGCSADGDAPSSRTDRAQPGTDVATAVPAPADPGPQSTHATIREVTGGRLVGAARNAVRERVLAVVDSWFASAYLGGTYPRTDFADAFPGFSAGAREQALADQRLMSNAAVGTTTYAVRPLARRVTIDVLAPDGRAAAATVQFRLGLARAGETGAERAERVSGRLYLTRTAGDGWQVFAYDVQRGVLS
ncbi:MAG: hypothetical protein JWN84_3308 [Nocardioides sp.]|nr:hypothetical protein [Nocardioides sp.]